MVELGDALSARNSLSKGSGIPPKSGGSGGGGRSQVPVPPVEEEMMLRAFLDAESPDTLANGGDTEYIALPNPAATTGKPVTVWASIRFTPETVKTTISPDVFMELAIDGTTEASYAFNASTHAITDGDEVQLSLSGHVTVLLDAGDHTFSIFLTNNSGKGIIVVDRKITAIEYPNTP